VPFRFLLVLLLAAAPAHAASAHFAPRELFRVPFGKDGRTLGTRIEKGQFLIPRDFTMDSAGHFYIYDSNNHRIVRYSSEGVYQMNIEYPETAKQVFAHADALENLWILISDPRRGLYYGVYDTHGKALREGLFSQFNQYRLHVDDDAVLHIIVSSDKNPDKVQTYLFDQDSLLMKKENIARPPEEHHRVRHSGREFYIDPVPSAAQDDASRIQQITDAERRPVASIPGQVVYVTGEGDVYTRVGERDIRVYDVDGSLKGKVTLTGLAAACAAIRFDSAGNIFELDGIPDKANQYTSTMPGMRLIFWERR